MTIRSPMLAIRRHLQIRRAPANQESTCKSWHPFFFQIFVKSCGKLFVIFLNEESFYFQQNYCEICKVCLKSVIQQMKEGPSNVMEKAEIGNMKASTPTNFRIEVSWKDVKEKKGLYLVVRYRSSRNGTVNVRSLIGATGWWGFSFLERDNIGGGFKFLWSHVANYLYFFFFFFWMKRLSNRLNYFQLNYCDYYRFIFIFFLFLFFFFFFA